MIQQVTLADDFDFDDRMTRGCQTLLLSAQVAREVDVFEEATEQRINTPFEYLSQ